MHHALTERITKLDHTVVSLQGKTSPPYSLLIEIFREILHGVGAVCCYSVSSRLTLLAGWHTVFAERH